MSAKLARCPGCGAARNEVERCAADPGPPRTLTIPGLRFRAISRTASCLAELLAQLVLGPHQGPLARRWQALAGAIDIECEHGKRGAKGIGLAAPASFRRPFQGGGNLLGIARCEDALVEGQRVAVFGHMTRPAPPRPGSARRPAALMRGTALGRSSSFACHGFTCRRMAI
jgi:hypothetical protein